MSDADDDTYRIRDLINGVGTLGPDGRSHRRILLEHVDAQYVQIERYGKALRSALALAEYHESRGGSGWDAAERDDLRAALAGDDEHDGQSRLIAELMSSVRDSTDRASKFYDKMLAEIADKMPIEWADFSDAKDGREAVILSLVSQKRELARQLAEARAEIDALRARP